MLSGALTLRSLADRHGDAGLAEAAGRIDAAVEQVLAGQVAVPCDLGGKAGCAEVTEAICRALR